MMEKIKEKTVNKRVNKRFELEKETAKILFIRPTIKEKAGKRKSVEAEANCDSPQGREK